MPELAEVEYYRKQWDAGLDERVTRVQLHARTRVFRGIDARQIKRSLPGLRCAESRARGKQMLFQFGAHAWIGLHLGMTGTLRAERLPFRPGQHDHLVIVLDAAALVFRDPRQFGRVRFDIGPVAPDWWNRIPAAPHEAPFTRKVINAFLARHPGLPIKATLLLQTGFAGVGNWMADEILWQAGIAPSRKTSALSIAEAGRLWRVTRLVCRTALRTIGGNFGDPPKGWLFHERWSRKGACPRHHQALECAAIGGRTTVWCARCQPA